MKIPENSIWINNKNLNEYKVLKEGIDCTNERDGLVVVIYVLHKIDDMLFVREKEEFLKKFTQKSQ